MLGIALAFMMGAVAGVLIMATCSAAARADEIEERAFREYYKDKLND